VIQTSAVCAQDYTHQQKTCNFTYKGRNLSIVQYNFIVLSIFK